MPKHSRFLNLNFLTDGKGHTKSIHYVPLRSEREENRFMAEYFDFHLLNLCHVKGVTQKRRNLRSVNL